MARILVVDDDPGVTKVLRIVLESAGHEVFVAHDGAHGLIAAHEHMPHVVLLDEVMPILTGSATLKALREDPKTSTIPVVMVTVTNGNGYTQRLFQMGVDMHITKPFDPNEIVEICGRLIPDECRP